MTEVLPEDAPKTAKPRTGSLFKDMSLETITLETALTLLSLPRVVGVDPDGVEITAQNGRYGPYLKKGTDSRSLEREEQLFSVTLDEALAIYAQPKQRGRAASAAAARARRRPGEQEAGPAEGGPVRPVRHRRRDQRHAPQGRRPGDDHAGAGGRTARRQAGQGPGAEEARGRARETTTKKTAAKKTTAKKKASKAPAG